MGDYLKREETKVQEAIAQWAKREGASVKIPNGSTSYIFLGSSGEFGRTYWDDVGFRSFDGQSAAHLPQAMTAFEATDHVYISGAGVLLGNWIRRPKAEFLMELKGEHG